LAYTSAIGFSLILMSAPIIQPILVFLTYVRIQSEPLDAATAFTTVALFNVMRFPFAFLPMGLLQYIQSKISLHRLERYFDLPELTEYVEPNPPPEEDENSPSAKDGSVTIRNGTFTWVDPDAAPIRPIQDEVPKKEPRKSRRSSSKKGEASDSGDDSDMKSSLHSQMRLSLHTLVRSRLAVWLLWLALLDPESHPFYPQSWVRWNPCTTPRCTSLALRVLRTATFLTVRRPLG
jgi:hypothetical protein